MKFYSIIFGLVLFVVTPLSAEEAVGVVPGQESFKKYYDVELVDGESIRLTLKEEFKPLQDQHPELLSSEPFEVPLGFAEAYPGTLTMTTPSGLSVSKFTEQAFALKEMLNEISKLRKALAAQNQLLLQIGRKTNQLTQDIERLKQENDSE